MNQQRAEIHQSITNAARRKDTQAGLQVIVRDYLIGLRNGSDDSTLVAALNRVIPELRLTLDPVDRPRACMEPIGDTQICGVFREHHYDFFADEHRFRSA